MKKNAIYPGTFDPITYGHIDVIKKALKFFDTIIVAISDGNKKDYLFSIDERIEIVKKSLFKDLNFKSSKIKVISFNSLTTSLCKKYNSNIILRGLRAVSDFEYEFQMASMNRAMSPDLDSIFLTPKAKYSFLSSSLVREIASMGGEVSEFVDPIVESALKDKFK